MARDNAMLEERKRLLETVEALLTAVNHASSEQRAAVDSMIEGSADMLDRVGTRFTEKIQTETGRLTDISAQVTGGAIRSEEHTSELQSLMRISYAVFCLKKKN